MIHPVIDTALLSRYDKTGPRYTSYPTANKFIDDFDAADYRLAAEASNRDSKKPISIYYHIPFCATLCFYCACNKVITKKRAKGEEYLTYLFKEIAMHGDLYNRDREVTQLHLGGGTPTFLSTNQISQLLTETGKHFNLSVDENRDFSIEIDPRTVDAGGIRELREIGFTRLSLGIQDFNPEVQNAVHRVQPEQKTLGIVDAARNVNFDSVSVDLIYGLPLQTASSFARTLETIINVSPDRLSIFNYAHMPHLFMPQRRIKEAELPSADEKINMLQGIVAQLTEAGYVYIGMDHFAKPDDSLVKSRDKGTLYRNFQGYASHADCDLIGMGITSISKVDNCYSQNVKTLDAYYSSILKQQLPVVRGITLNPEDRIRREIIETLMCYGEIEFSSINNKYSIDFKCYFSNEMIELEEMARDGLICIDNNHISVRPSGRFLIRNISMVFDQYIDAGETTSKFSRLI